MCACVQSVCKVLELRIVVVFHVEVRLVLANIGNQEGDDETKYGGGVYFLEPKIFSFSSLVWKRPWPNLELVSMNLRVIFSVATRRVCLNKD